MAHSTATKRKAPTKRGINLVQLRMLGDQIHDLTGEIHNLLTDNRHPGLSTWHDMLDRRLRRLYELLGPVYGAKQ